MSSTSRLTQLTNQPLADARLEGLERRQMLSVSVDGATLVIDGTDGADVISLSTDPFLGGLIVNVNGEEIRWSSASLAGFESVRITANAGDDQVIIADNLPLPAYIDGGAGNDVLQGGMGDDTLLGGDGDDSLTGGAGSDLMDGGPGVNVLVSDASDLFPPVEDDNGGGEDGGEEGDAHTKPGNGHGHGWGHYKGRGEGHMSSHGE